ncbi:PqiC family protein [Rheinheimera oceanensis]|uniref:PqiC family protein n=1 Tax=Rheinheimera oceanensis TaxID=2817449 RepID=UPI001BFDCA0D|nr:ABC-type transport auxiliary lipoprotein family protein [Rheinheimera oceanensis]
MRHITAALLLLLTGCASQPASNYYQLPAAPVTQASSVAEAGSLYIEPVQVASYLNGRGLVLQLSDVELVTARQHLWAEALDQQLQRQLRDRVVAQTSGYAAVLQARPDTVRVSVQLDQFHGLADGHAIVSGRFAVSTQPGSQPFNIRIALTNDGYPALVQALGQAVQQLSQQIARQLTDAA